MSATPLASDGGQPREFEASLQPLRARVDAVDRPFAAVSAGPLPGAGVRALFTPLLQYFVERYSPQDR